MSFPYLDDLLAQPQALADTIAGLRSAAPLTDVARELHEGRYRRIVLTGMGSSFYAAHPLALRLSAAGLWAAEAETSELNYYYPAWLAPDSLLVAISQSGASAETVRLLALSQHSCGKHPSPFPLPSRGEGKVTVAGVTNEAESPLARAADVTVLMRAGHEASVSCKTYLATLAALAWLGDQLLPEEPPWLPHIGGAIPAVAAYLANWQSHVAWLQETLRGIRQLYLVGRGPSLATVGTGGLILKESTHLPAEGLSSAAFRHGPFEIVSPQTYVLAFAGAEATAALNAHLIADVLAAGGRGALVGPDGEGAFAIPPVPEPALPILEMLPVQMMTLALAALQGFEPGRFALGSKVTTVE
ncbi:MAG: SIS domain-containing protein [Anaerolineae bacterium]